MGLKSNLNVARTNCKYREGHLRVNLCAQRRDECSFARVYVSCRRHVRLTCTVHVHIRIVHWVQLVHVRVCINTYRFSSVTERYVTYYLLVVQVALCRKCRCWLLKLSINALPIHQESLFKFSKYIVINEIPALSAL